MNEVVTYTEICLVCKLSSENCTLTANLGLTPHTFTISIARPCTYLFNLVEGLLYDSDVLINPTYFIPLI